MKFLRKPVLLALCLFVLLNSLAAQTRRKGKKPAKAAPAATEEANFGPVDALIQQEVGAQGITGAVLLVGHDGKIVHQKAFGLRATSPHAERMTLDTIFDLASMTKVVATTPSVMRLIQFGQIRLNDPVSRYIPEFGANGKQYITVRELMTHYSGLPGDIELNVPWEGEQEGFRRANEEKPVIAPGAEFLYSDINFIVLGELIQRVAGMGVDKYADAHIFQPLGMTHTRFLPPPEWRDKIAETLAIDNRRILRGFVHDPTAERMGGVAGHAGLFSTAGDLALYAQALMDGDKILTPDLIEKMTTPQQPPNSTNLRGLGWDLDSWLATNRGDLLPIGSFGHTGFTGTSIWIDPYTKTYIILLTNTVRPRQPSPPTVSLRARVADAVASVLNLKVTAGSQEKLLSITGYNETMTAARRLDARNGHVLTGIDVLEQGNFAQLKQDKQQITIGLLTNQTGLDAQGKRTIDVLAKAPGIKLSIILSPEHGIFGNVDSTNTPNSVDSATGIPIYSLYGVGEAKRHPPVEILKTLDAVVMDIQDAGARFYTYAATLGYLLEAAAQSNTEVIVLDRPDPITGSFVQGPMSEPEQGNFNNYQPVPLRHGMTLGEMAQMFNVEGKIGARLRVIPMQGWVRGDWFDSTGITWVNPSPNLRSVNENTLYPGVALIERTNISVGRGTDTPFEIIGAPWIDPKTLANFLNARMIPGVRFIPVTFTPSVDPYANQRCGGVNMIVTERNVLDSPELGIELVSALHTLYPNDWKIAKLNELLSNHAVLNALSAGDDPRHIAEEWRDDLERFMQVRGKYLLYK